MRKTSQTIIDLVTGFILIVSFGVLNAFGLVSCNVADDMVYVPTPEQIKEDYPEFLLKESALEGLYANRDVDSVVFRYTPNLTRKNSFQTIRQEIIENAKKKGWKFSGDSEDLVFNRFRSEGKLFSWEEAHVVIVRNVPRIYLAYVQADTRKSVTQFDDTSESNFAKQVVWPMLKSYATEDEAQAKPTGGLEKDK